MTSGATLPVVILVTAVVLGLTAPPAVIAVLTVLVTTVLALACVVVSRRRSGGVRLAWITLGAGILATLLGPGRLVFVGLAALCLFAIPSPKGTTRLTRVRAAIDGLLIGCSLFVTSYNVVMQPALAAGRADAVVRPVADVLLATVALAALSRWSAHYPGSRALAPVCFGLLTMAVADSAAMAGVGPSLAGAGWCAGLTLILLATVRAVRNPLATYTPDDQPRAGRWSVGVVLPHAVVVLTLVVGGLWMTQGGHATPVGTWCRFACVLLIVLRGVLLSRDNKQLARKLEGRVISRTAELASREQHFRALVEQSSESLAILEADSTVRYQSSSVERIFGFPVSALVGHRLVDVVGRKAAPQIQAAIDDVIGRPGGMTAIEVRLPHEDGTHRLSEMIITNKLDDPYIRGLVFNTRDISEARQLQDQLRHDAYHDALTGLENRALFRERLATAVGGQPSPEHVSVLFLDLDGFKEVNDSLGHAAGDQLLVQVAARLLHAVPAPHTVARLGGDEFAVIVVSPDARADAEALATRILEHLDEPFSVDGRELHVGAGIGIASAADAGDIEQLQRNADLAMYRAKDAGGGVYAAYHPNMHDALVQRLSLADDLRLALERDELVLHYQPTVDLADGTIVGFEALVRWNHPERGTVPPLDFIGLAESTGLIVPLGRWVLAEACRQAVAWGRPLKMAVNVSVRQFEAGDLAATVAEVLAETGMPADQLCLEMTESVLLTDTDENLARIVSLKALGVLLAMDDFGTGYSSLAYLRRFPMDVLKIDRSFVDHLGSGDAEDETLVRTIVRLGQRFGMRTVAEGIENAAQVAALREMNCDFGQGYFLSRPVPAVEATRLLESGLPALSTAATR
uniref:putative bifunctional diguanylate cyclase/phosphodiesterase n=1 Tax=Paractinoplanes polyasparticus TaxID=2856853 RepID=UPI001C85D3FA|nr:bifunctional diguanylate cyclase/phosphodiesterase [Actinoplanes polyasparticus]